MGPVSMQGPLNERVLILKKKVLTNIILLLTAVLLSGCGSSPKQENLTTNTDKELEAEGDIEQLLEDTYDETFEVNFITELQNGFTGSALTEEGQEIQFTLNGEGILTSNYMTMEYQDAMEDLILQASMGLDCFQGYTASIVRAEEEDSYPDISSYLKNGNYTVGISLQTEKPFEECLTEITKFEQAMQEAGLRNILTVSGETLDFQHEFPEQVDEESVQAAYDQFAAMSKGVSEW